MGVLTPTRVELLYRVEPNVLKPDVPLQTRLAHLVKTKAAERVARGESLRFRFSVDGLFEIDVQPREEHVSLPRKARSLEFLVHRTDTTASSQALVKHMEGVLHSEMIYPNAESLERFSRLVGLKREKELALQMLSHLFSPASASAWGRKYHCETLVENLLSEPAYPVLVFEGPPGLGKTELARTIGDPLARALGSPVVSYSVRLTLRGHGLVGELTQNIAKLMEFARLRHLERGAPLLLLIDEADAIAQKRESEQPQHHEDQAGVNALLEQIDDLRSTPGVGIILTTNMHWALDEAIKKRTNAQWIRFPLPGSGVRFYLFRRFLGSSFAAAELRQLARVTEGFAPRDIVELCRATFYKAVSKDAPLTLSLMLKEVSILSASAAKESHGKRVPLQTNSQFRLVESTNHVNGQSAKKTAA